MNAGFGRATDVSAHHMKQLWSDFGKPTHSIAGGLIVTAGQQRGRCLFVWRGLQRVTGPES